MKISLISRFYCGIRCLCRNAKLAIPMLGMYAIATIEAMPGLRFAVPEHEVAGVGYEAYALAED